MGADYLQYVQGDAISLPIEQFEKYYTEKFIHLPRSSLANSMAYMADISPPDIIKTNSSKAFGCGGDEAGY